MNKWQDSSITTSPWNDGDMIRIDHFTGSLLVSKFEANQLRSLLTQLLGDTPVMPIAEAERLQSDRQTFINDFLQKATA